MGRASEKGGKILVSSTCCGEDPLAGLGKVKWHSGLDASLAMETQRKEVTHELTKATIEVII